MSPEDIALIRTTFGLTQRDLARSLNVAPFTVARWEENRSTPTGLQDEVLRALHTVALRSVNQGDSSRFVGALIGLGIGALIVSALNQSQKEAADGSMARAPRRKRKV